MKNNYVLRSFTFACFFVIGTIASNAQSFNPPAEYDPVKSSDTVQISSTLAASQVRAIALELNYFPISNLGVPTGNAIGTFLTAKFPSPLVCDVRRQSDGAVMQSGVSCSTAVPADRSLVLQNYTLKISYVDKKGKNKVANMVIALLDPSAAVDNLSDVKADSDEDANYYISGNITGARKRKTAFTTEIKLQPYQKYFHNGSLQITPVYFKLNASTAADADPDSMEIGTRLRKILGRFAGARGAYFDNTGKLESERDFNNTNLVYEGKFTLLPEALGRKSKKTKVFINPFLGTELGKNLKSPLLAAEGDGIGRVLIGADLRIAFLRGGKPWANWTTSYTRRWLLTNELAYDTDDNDNLVLIQHGKSPRDYFESKFSFKANTFANAFIAYDWGEVPPSYKKINHRFRIGFEFKRKTVIE